MGAAVTLAVRNLEAGKVVAQRITHATGNHEVLVRPLDLADQQSIAAFVAGWKGRLHILINNALDPVNAERLWSIALKLILQRHM